MTMKALMRPIASPLVNVWRAMSDTRATLSLHVTLGDRKRWTTDRAGLPRVLLSKNPLSSMNFAFLTPLACELRLLFELHNFRPA